MTLADLSEYVCGRIACSGDAASFEPLGEHFDSKWSYQTSAFYVELGRWVSDGHIDAEGEDVLSRQAPAAKETMANACHRAA